jgi:hypothetical protein
VACDRAAGPVRRDLVEAANPNDVLAALRSRQDQAG